MGRSRDVDVKLIDGLGVACKVLWVGELLLFYDVLGCEGETDIIFVV